MRLIDADALMDASKYEFWQDGSAITPIGEYILGKFRQLIRNMPTVTPEPHWIPCSERLPEEYGECRITWVTSSAPSKRFIGDAEYEITSVWDDEREDFKCEWILDDYIKHYPDVKVIAWKPLEEPYREDEGCQST